MDVQELVIFGEGASWPFDEIDHVLRSAEIIFVIRASAINRPAHPKVAVFESSA